MKIIHCADLHLDSQMTANLTKEQARERKREIIRTFTRRLHYQYGCKNLNQCNTGEFCFYEYRKQSMP